MKHYFLLMALLSCIVITTGTAQKDTYKHLKKDTKITIKGTSTLHDWTVKAGTVTNLPEKITLNKLKDFSFKVKVASLDGGRGASMNKKIYKALKSKQHPYIIYKQKGKAKIKKTEKAGVVQLVSKGVVEIAGVKKTIFYKSKRNI